MRPEDAKWIIDKGPDPDFYKHNLTVMDWIAEAKKILEKENNE